MIKLGEEAEDGGEALVPARFDSAQLRQALATRGNLSGQMMGMTFIAAEIEQITANAVTMGVVTGIHQGHDGILLTLILMTTVMIITMADRQRRRRKRRFADMIIIAVVERMMGDAVAVPRWSAHRW